MSQQHLFDGFIRQKNCSCCRRRLHPDRSRQYRTREAGLCWKCLREFESSSAWSVEKFLAGKRINAN